MREHACLTVAVATAIAAAVPSSAIAAPDGFLDPTFGQGGQQIVSADLEPAFSLGSGTNLALLSDGHIVLAASSMKDQLFGIGLARLKPDGQVDESFNPPIFRPDALDGIVVTDAVAQPDGKVLVSGVTMKNLDRQALVCRFRPDGSLDTEFAKAPPNMLGPGCRAFSGNGLAGFYAIALQRDGRILLSGTTATLGQSSGRALVVRLNAQGNIDPSFDGDGVHVLPAEAMTSTTLLDVTTTPDGDLVAVGTVTINSNNNWQIFRLRGENGALDLEFDGGDGIKTIAFDKVPSGFDQAVAVSVLPDGRIVVGGQAEGLNSDCPAIVRLWPNGDFDESLEGGGLFVAEKVCLSGLSIKDMLMQSDGRAVLAGEWSGSFFATRILPQGGLDKSFGLLNSSWFDFGPMYGVKKADSYAYRIANQAGRLTLAGLSRSEVSESYDFAVARLDNDLIFTDNLE